MLRSLIYWLFTISTHKQQLVPAYFVSGVLKGLFTGGQIGPNHVWPETTLRETMVQVNVEIMMACQALIILQDRTALTWACLLFGLGHKFFWTCP